jgi:hypothetical protein
MILNGIAFVVTRVEEARYVDVNDWTGYHVPGKVVLHTVDQIPVDRLPGAELEQYGHTDAEGHARLRLREARRLLGRDAEVGDFIVADAGVEHRNNGQRKAGVFYCRIWKTKGTKQ